MAGVSEHNSFSDEVPVADAVEQQRPAAEPADDDSLELGGGVPLEINESDWQEQLRIVDDPDEDEIR